jgi:hypothetical protein
MTLLLGFLPFAVFAVVDRVVSTLLALTLAAVTAAGLTLRDVAGKKRLKLLDVGAAVVFGGLALYTFFTQRAWSVVGVRLCTDAGLLAIVLISLAIRQPFTLQYAKEQVPEQHWADPGFVRTNYRLSAVWAAAFALMVLADVGMLLGLPVALGVVITLGALGGAFYVTSQVKKK